MFIGLKEFCMKNAGLFFVTLFYGDIYIYNASYQFANACYHPYTTTYLHSYCSFFLLAYNENSLKNERGRGLIKWIRL